MVRLKKPITTQVTGNNFIYEMTSFSYIDESFDYNITNSYFLSIRVSPDGFSFCTLDPVLNRFIQIQHIPFNSNKSIISQIEQSFREVGKLNLPYKKTLVLIPSSDFTIVPSAIFNKEDKEIWMNFTTKMSDDSSLISNKIKLADATHLFILSNEIKNIFKRQFELPIFYHPHSPIIENNLSTNITDGSNKLMFINVEYDYIDILVFGNNNLQLCNSFKIKSNNDFIYFTLFVFEQMRLNISDTSVIVSGHHSDFDNMTAQLMKYIKNVKYANFPYQFQYSHIFKDINPTRYHTLFSLSTCV